MNRPLRRTRTDLLVTGVLTVFALGCVGATYLTAPIRTSNLTPAAQDVESQPDLTVVPSSLHEEFRLADTSPGPAPVVAEGLIMNYADGVLHATTPSGETVWTYKRAEQLCGLSHAWGKLVATYRGPAGCGEVVAIDARTGEYSSTRSAVAPDEVTSVSSNDRVGYVSPQRVELWRSDMVRTVEYGQVEAPQESNAQPNACTITSALTRKELIAVTENCADGTWLRMQKTTPQDSRKPEISANVHLDPGSHLVAVSPSAAAVYSPETSQLQTFDDSGDELSTGSAPQLASEQDQVPTADLPHHMTAYMDGTLALFNPDTLALSCSFDDALGTGVAVGDRLLYPVNGAIAVADWRRCQTQQHLPLDRGTDTSQVSLAVAGSTIVEKRGDELVVLAAQ